MANEALDMFLALEMLARMSPAQWRIFLAALAKVAGAGHGSVTVEIRNHVARRVVTTVSTELPAPGPNEQPEPTKPGRGYA